MTDKRRARGFTLIEVMTAVAIVGALASVAIPAFEKVVLRAKVAERTTISQRIKQSIQDYYVRNGRSLPSSYGGFMASGYNPPFPPTTHKRPLATDLATWNVYFSAPGGGSGLAQEIEGNLFYSYAFQVEEAGGATARIWVWAAGDLDGDAVYSYKYLRWDRLNGVYQEAYEYPSEGEEDDHGPYLTF